MAPLAGMVMRGAGPNLQQRAQGSERVAPGDVFLCYLKGLSCWCGALEVESDAFEADQPIYGNADPYTLRFAVKPLVLLDADRAISIREPAIKETLSFTCGRSGATWTGPLRASLRLINEADGDFLMSRLLLQEWKTGHAGARSH